MQFHQSKHRAKGPLELVHSAICGRIGEKSLGGSEYFLTFTDDYSRYSWVYMLKTKNQVFDAFMDWKVKGENCCGKKLKRLRTDNGGEYMSNQFKSYLKNQGICHELTIPKNPEQNGNAESLNRTLVESSCSMLLDAKFPKKYWGEVACSAVYLKNRWPIKALQV